MWSTSQLIHSIVQDVLCNHRDDKIIELEDCLKKHKDAFLNPMKILKKSAADRQMVRTADVEAISITGIPQKIMLTHEMIEETFAISDLFDMNELTTVELLLSAEAQLPSHPNLTRGLVAITLFYDSHRLLLEALKMIIQSREGRLWSSKMSAEAAHLVHSFTTELSDNGLLRNILTFLSSFNVENEFSRLESVRALGGPQHRRDIFRFLVYTRDCLAECFLLWVAQTPLDFKCTKFLFNHLVAEIATDSPKCCITTDTLANSAKFIQNSEPLDHSTIHLIISLLFCFEPFGVPGKDVDQLADAEKQDLMHPLFTDISYVEMITRLLTAPTAEILSNAHEVEGFFGLIQLSWAICLRRVNHLRMDLLRRQRNAGERVTSFDGPSRSSPTTTSSSGSGVVDEDLLVSTALESNAIEFLYRAVLLEGSFSRENLWVRRIHGLVTDLLVQFPQNVQEIRLRDEAVARRTGLDPCSQNIGFIALLNSITRLYNVSGSPLHARLSFEYWWPAGETVDVADNLLRLRSSRIGENENSRQAILFRFVYSASEFASSPLLFVAYVNMLRSLVGCRSSANLCFNLLKATASTGGRLASILTWNHFINSLKQYFDHLNRTPSTGYGHDLGLNDRQSCWPPHLQHPHLYQTAEYEHSKQIRSQVTLQSQQQQNQPQPPLAIQPEEIDALRAVVSLISRVCFMDPIARSTFATFPQWKLVQVVVGLLTCPLPLSMKADLLQLLTSLCRCSSISGDVWRSLCDAKLFAFVESSKPPLKQFAGIHTEIDVVEAKAEEYSITRAFVNLLTQLSSCVGGLLSESSLPIAIQPLETYTKVVQFVLESVFLKHTMRAYRRSNERWEVAASCLVLFEGLVLNFLQRMKSVAVLISNSNDSSCADAHLATLDWSPLLFDKQSSVRSFSNLFSSSDTSFSGLQAPCPLRLPQGWPLCDPGYQIVVQLLTNSFLFSMCTGLLEVGIHRFLEFSILGSPAAMARATASILRMFQQILPYEEILVNLVRRASLSMPQIKSYSTGQPRIHQPREIILPMLLSRLLVSTVNARTGRSDLLVTIVRYCSFAEELPDHCLPALRILCSVIRKFQPHESVLNVLTSDKKLEQDILHSLVSCLARTGDTENDTCSLNSEVESNPNSIFTDAWLSSAGLDSELTVIGCETGFRIHPAMFSARTLAAFPLIPADWEFPDSYWEFFTAAPIHTQTSSDASCPTLELIDTDDELWFPHSLCQNVFSSPRSILLHLILSSLLHHPCPSVAHWLLGFRFKDSRSVSLTTIQDAGVGGFPQTCLHTILDLVEVAVTSSRDLFDSDVYSMFIHLHWDAAIAWQILYRLLASSPTSVPVARYLRGNHDLVSRHLTTGLVSTFLNPKSMFSQTTDKVLRALILNQLSWLLKMTAIELQSSVSQRAYLSRLLNNLFSESSSAQNFKGNSLCQILSQMNISEQLISPSWVFSRTTDDSKLMENIILSCEEQFSLVDCGEQASIASLLIKIPALASRLNVISTSAKTTARDSDSTPASSALVSEVIEFAKQRNLHRLFLVAGKQSSLEGWRQTVEIGLRMLKFLIQMHPDSLRIQNSAHGQSLFDDVLLSRCSDSRTITPSNTLILKSATSLLLSLFQEVSSPNSTPTLLKVLGSGSSLSLSGFLQLAVLPQQKNSPSQNVLYDAQRVLLAVGHTRDAILSSKPTLQRIRANYYGSLCNILDICQQLDNLSSSSDDLATSFVLRAVGILVGTVGDDLISMTKTSNFNKKSFLAILFEDISNGNHPIIPISALSLLILLVKFDRSSGQVIDCILKDGCLQYIVDSLSDDLTHLQENLLSRDSTAIQDCQASLTDATAAFYVYQSKMALLSIMASVPLGAKALIQNDLLEKLSRFEIFSASSLADILDNVLLDSSTTPIDANSSDNIAWLNSSDCTRLICNILSNQNENSVDTVSTKGAFFSFGANISNIFTDTGSSNAAASVASPDSSSLNWFAILLPVLYFMKALLITLGSNHVSGVQKTSKFLFAHSDALLTTIASTNASMLLSSAISDLYADGDSTRKPVVQFRCIMEWLQGEENLVSILAFIMRSRAQSRFGESDDLSRELICSKILRHVFSILPNLFRSLQSSDQPAFGEMNNSNIRSTFQRGLLITKQMHLLRLLVNTCVSAILTEDEIGNFESAGHSKSLVFSSSLSSSISSKESLPDISVARPSLGIVLQLVSWSAERLHQLESAVTSIGRYLPFADSTDNKEDLTGGSMQKILRNIISLPFTENLEKEISTDSMRQILAILFSIRPMTSDNLITRDMFICDSGQRNDYLWRLMALGGTLVHSRLRCLLDVLQQSLYLLWKHIQFYLSKQSMKEESEVKMKPEFVSFCATPKRPLSGLERKFNSPSRVSTVGDVPSEPISSPMRRYRKISTAELLDLAESLPRRLNFDLLDSVSHISKASYVSTNQRLFLQVMLQKLERLSQLASKITSDAGR